MDIIVYELASLIGVNILYDIIILTHINTGSL